MYNKHYYTYLCSQWFISYNIISQLGMAGMLVLLGFIPHLEFGPGVSASVLPIEYAYGVTTDTDIMQVAHRPIGYSIEK